MSLRQANRRLPLRHTAHLDRLHDVVKDRNAPQKHVGRAQIVLLSAEGAGTNAIMRETGKAKTCV